VLKVENCFCLRIAGVLEIIGDNFGMTLQAACLGGNLEIVELILEEGAGPNVQGTDTSTTSDTSR
jgi:hypothetical protein